jgi:glucosylglycerate synthase
MASTETKVNPVAASPFGVTSGILVSLSPLPQEAFDLILGKLALAFRGEDVLVVSPDVVPQSAESPLRLLSYNPTTVSGSPWILTAADYLLTYKLAQEHQISACILLGGESQSLSPESIRALAKSVQQYDLTLARYDLGPHEGLVNAAILYPVTRALFGTRPRFPLAIDVGLSLKMAGRLAAVAQRSTSAGQNDAILWPLSEAAAANCTIAEVSVGTRAFPHPIPADLNAVLAQVAGSLFADVEAKASFWQRARGTQPLSPVTPSPLNDESPTDIAAMIDAFRLAYTNLHEIWSLVLPPNSLLGLKKLSLATPETFRMPDNLWARMVYDFILAFRLRTINRGHLLGALTPLYLAWTASHLTLITNGTSPEKHIQDLAVAFETDKPYFVARWRWPDRFNP